MKSAYLDLWKPKSGHQDSACIYDGVVGVLPLLVGDLKGYGGCYKAGISSLNYKDFLDGGGNRAAKVVLGSLWWW